MGVIAGIDEAGYGPTLGPLVVTMTAFEGESIVPDCDLWEGLGGVVSKHPGEDIFVADSKVVFSGGRLDRLERGVLGFFAASGRMAPSLCRLRRSIGNSDDDWHRYPWYGNRDLPLPRAVDIDTIERASNRLAIEMARQGVSFCDVESVIVTAGEFNEKLSKYGSKLSLLFSKVAGLLRRVWDRFGEGHPTVFVDRQGGRKRYLPLLMDAFPGRWITKLRETRDESAYEVISRDRKMRVHFVVDGDSRVFSVALASMCSKYLRELHMELLNGFWRREKSDIKPTGGYPADARRFLQEINEVLNELGIEKSLLVRQC